VIPPPARIPAALLTIVTVVHLGAQLAHADLLGEVTQVMLMPLLAWALWAATTRPHNRLVCLVLVALGFSWLGDTVPRFVPDDPGFLAMVGFFLVAQVLYIAAFWPLRNASILRRPALVGPYVLVIVVLVWLCADGAGALLAPVVVYGVALATMAVLSTVLGRLGGLGGAIFLLSDSLIAIGAFTDIDIPGRGFWVMLTYVVGQALLSLAVVRMTEGSYDAAATA